MTTGERAARGAAARRALGVYGEELAARHLVGQGMVLLDRNWRCAEGEIDLVLRDGAVLVFCEVKTRRGVSHGTPHEAVTPVKLDRLTRLAAAWQRERGVAVDQVRIDLVGVVRPLTGATQVDHVRGLV
ncbi:YraN family protein [Nocardioides sp. GCM10027113]|uniref:YraN family protein n=1 Tax=unclassified Nocardioides TaxID=2615069 RepID=UPI0036171B69